MKIVVVVACAMLVLAGIILIPLHFMTETTIKSSDYPDWLINNPNWQLARELTNSDFASFDTSYIHQNNPSCRPDCITNINNHGFRGKDFPKEKSDNMFRIFAVGGSATFGTNVNDDETWPAYLQKKFEEVDLGFEVEIINAGIKGANTSNELQLIKDVIVNLEPDLVIMYDGVNDAQALRLGLNGPTISETIQNWKSVCKLGNEIGFKTIVIIQPDSSTGKRVPTISDLIFYSIHTNELLQKPTTLYAKDKLSAYPEKFTELTECAGTANFKSIFDYFMIPIYFDVVHVNPAGNQIIANKTFETIMPHITNLPSNEIKAQINHNYKSDESDELVVYAVDTNLSGKNFENLDLRNAIFYKSDLTGANFANTNLKNADFRLANLSDANFKGANLENTLFHYAKFDSVDISEGSLSKIDLRYTDISSAILTNTDLSDKNLTGTNLSGQDISGHDLANTIFKITNLSNTKLADGELSGKNFGSSAFIGVDLSGKDLSLSDFSHSRLNDANFKNARLWHADFYSADLTNADLSGADLRNAFLARADLSNANLEGANLEGATLDNAILSNANLKCFNHVICS